MAKNPKDDASDALEPPSAAAAQRAKPLFDRLVGEVRAQRGAPAEGEGRVREFPGGRRYDVALALLAETEGASEVLDAAEVTRVAVAAPDWSLEPTVVGPRPLEPAPLPSRPPPGAPAVRQSVQAGRAAPSAVDPMLEKAADAALLRTEADGTMSFDIVFRDDIFADLTCTISVRDGHAVAVFRVADDNLRRLLESEAGRLRAGLEGRGLKVAEIRVLVDPL